jgi:hypothetical protein
LPELWRQQTKIIPEPPQSPRTNAGYGGHFRAAQGFKYIGDPTQRLKSAKGGAR